MHEQERSLLIIFAVLLNVKIIIYMTIIYPVVLYGCEVWSLKMGEEHRLREFEKSIRREIFGPKTNEMIVGCWRILHSEELQSLYSSVNIVRMIKSRKM